MDGDLTDQLTSLAEGSSGLRLSIAVALLPSQTEAKKDKDDVNYGAPTPDDGDKRCGNCQYYDPEPRNHHCEIVDGTISPNAICDLWDGDDNYPGDRLDGTEYGSSSESSRSANADSGPISDTGYDHSNSG